MTGLFGKSKHRSWLLGCLVLCTLPVTTIRARAEGCQVNDPSPTPAKTRPSARLKFTRGDMGELRTAEGIHLSFTHFAVSDGAGLMSLYEDFRTADSAQQYFEAELKRAAKVLAQSTKKGNSEKTGGRRAEILMRLQNNDKTACAIVWTVGPVFREIYSDSWQNVLDFELVAGP
jgi:hypothetical protein